MKIVKKNGICQKLILIFMMIIVVSIAFPYNTLYAITKSEHEKNYGKENLVLINDKDEGLETYKADLPDKYNNMKAEINALKNFGFKENQIYICFGGHLGSSSIEAFGAINGKSEQGYYAKKEKNGTYTIWTNEGNQAEDGVINGEGNKELDKPANDQEQEKHDQANEEGERSEALIGGKLLTPICDLLMTLGDAIMQVLQKAIVGSDATITLDLSTHTKVFWKVIGIIAAIAVVAVISIVTAGIGTAIVGPIASAIFTAVTGSGIFSMVVVGVGILTYAAVSGFSAKFLPDITVFPTYSIGPEEIFEGKLAIFDINFFKPKQVYVHLKNGSGEKKLQEYKEDRDGEAEYYYYYENNNVTTNEEDRIVTSKQNTAISLSGAISKWYYAIRNLAVVVMMLVLVYIGIRMMLCSIASEKAKYKKMLGDWIVSMCLVFVLHYIMVFAVTINESIVKLVNSSLEKNQYIIELSRLNERDKFISKVEKNEDLKQGLADESENNVYDKDGNKVGGTPAMFIWPTNLMGQVRMLSQMQNGSVEYVGYVLAYLVLVLYTLFFAFTYLKRVVYMAFLTVIAPLVAMTYSIDKIADGKAQAFNMWLKEYIFNLLIQPVHLLLYMLLISMAYQLASQNIIYTLVAIGFMMPAEKLIRSMFGFDKAKTPGFLGGATGAALTMGALQKLDKFAGRGPGAKKPGEKTPRLANNGISNSDESRGADSGKNFSSLLLGDDKAVGQDSDNDKGKVLEQGNDVVPSVADAGLNLKEGENPEMRMEREAVDAEGQMNDSESADDQKELLGKEKQQTDNAPLLNESLKRQRYVNPYKKKRKELKKSVGTARSRFGRYISSPKNWGRSIKDATAKTAKAGARISGVALGAGIGVASGIASGDLSKTVQNAALGSSIGNSIAAGGINRVSTGISNLKDNYNNQKEQKEREVYGEDYSKYKKAEQDKKFFYDSEKREKYAEEFSNDLKGLKGKERESKIDEIMKSAIKYREYGVTDDSLITKAMKLDKNGNKEANDSIAAAMMASKGKDLDGIEKYKDLVSKQVGENKAGEIAEKARNISGLYKG